MLYLCKNGLVTLKGYRCSEINSNLCLDRARASLVFFHLEINKFTCTKLLNIPINNEADNMKCLLRIFTRYVVTGY